MFGRIVKNICIGYVQGVSFYLVSSGITIIFSKKSWDNIEGAIVISAFWPVTIPLMCSEGGLFTYKDKMLFTGMFGSWYLLLINLFLGPVNYNHITKCIQMLKKIK